MQVQVNTDSHIEGGARLAQEVESIVQQALDRFGDRITRVEVFLTDENSSQKSGERDKRCVIEARLGGLPPISVTHDGSSAHQAVTGAAGRLEKTLKRTLGRKGSIYKRRVRELAELTAAEPVLKQDVESGKQDDFQNVLRPLLGPLAKHAQRELRIMEASGTLSPGQVRFGDLLDDLVARAWLEYADRPSAMALDLWLTKILDDMLEALSDESQRNQRALDLRTDERLPRNAPQVGDQEWWVWLLGEDGAAATESGTPAGQSTWAEEFLETEELMHRIFAMLGQLPKLQRQAFVLNNLEGYDVMEIAMVQSRSEPEVESDIEKARGYLRERLRGDGESKAAMESTSEARTGDARA